MLIENLTSRQYLYLRFFHNKEYDGICRLDKLFSHFYEMLMARNPDLEVTFNWQSLADEFLKDISEANDDVKSWLTFCSDHLTDEQISFYTPFLVTFYEVSVLSEVTEPASQLLGKIASEFLSTITHFKNWKLPLSYLGYFIDTTKLPLEKPTREIIEALNKLEPSNLFSEQNLDSNKLFVRWLHKLLLFASTKTLNDQSMLDDVECIGDFIRDENIHLESRTKNVIGVFHQGSEAFCVKKTIETKIEDNISDYLGSVILQAATLNPSFASSKLIKSDDNIVYLASKMIENFSPLNPNQHNLTNRLSLKEQSELLTVLNTSQKEKFAKLIAESFLIGDYDAHSKDICKNNFMKCDHKWALDGIAKLAPMVFLDELSITRNEHRYSPTNALLDYKSIILSEAFVNAVMTLKHNFDKNKIRSEVAQALENIITLYSNSTASDSNVYTATSEVLSWLRTRIKIDLDRCSIEELKVLLIQKLPDMLEFRMNSLVITAKIIEMTLLNTETQANILYHKLQILDEYLGGIEVNNTIPNHSYYFNTYSKNELEAVFNFLIDQTKENKFTNDLNALTNLTPIMIEASPAIIHDLYFLTLQKNSAEKQSTNELQDKNTSAVASSTSNISNIIDTSTEENLLKANQDQAASKKPKEKEVSNKVKHKAKKVRALPGVKVKNKKGNPPSFQTTYNTRLASKRKLNIVFFDESQDTTPEVPPKKLNKVEQEISLPRA